MTFCQLSFSEGILYSNRAAGSSETLVGVSKGRNNFYSVGPQPTEERMFSSFRIGLFLAQTLSMIQNLNKTLGLEHGSKNFINASVIDTDCSETSSKCSSGFANNFMVFSEVISNITLDNCRI